MRNPTSDTPKLELPLIFQGPMVRAILQPEGFKNQTRRMTGLDEINQNPDQWEYIGPVYAGTPNFRAYTGLKKGRIYTSFLNTSDGSEKVILVREGVPGSYIWVKETHVLERWDLEFGTPEIPADRPHFYHDAERNEYDNTYWLFPHYKATDPAPDLDVGKDEPGCNWRPSIFMERWVSRILLRITKIRVERLQSMPPIDAISEGVYKPQLHYGPAEAPYAIASFANKWDEIHGQGAWDHNPWVRVITFERVKP